MTAATRILGGNLTGAGSNFNLISVADENFVYSDLRNAGALVLPREVQNLDSLTNPVGSRPVSATTTGTWPALAAMPAAGVMEVVRESATQFRQRLSLRTNNLAFERWYNGTGFSAWKSTRPVQFSAVYDTASLLDGAGVTTTIAAAGAVGADYVSVSNTVDIAGIILTAWVSGAGIVSVRFQNETGGAIDLASATITATAYYV